MEAAAWGLIGTIVGASASIATTWLSNRNVYKLQNQKALDERKERANAFQRQTLIDLQEAIHDALRLVNRAYIEDQRAYVPDKKWGSNSLTDEVNEGIRLANRRVAILIERVSSDVLRVNVKALISSATGVLLARSEDVARASMNTTSSTADEVLEQIGATLRQHY